MAGIAIVIMGLMIPVCVYGYFGGVRWNPLDQPVLLSSGSAKQTFRVNYTARYFAKIGFDSGAIPHDRLLCLTGIRGFSRVIAPECKVSDAVLDFSWDLSLGETTIQSGHYDQANSGGGSSPEFVHADFVYFDGTRGEVYTLTIHHISPKAQVLDVANPRLLVSVNPVNYESAVVWKKFSWIATIVLVFIGAFIIVLSKRSLQR